MSEYRVTSFNEAGLHLGLLSLSLITARFKPFSSCFIAYIVCLSPSSQSLSFNIILWISNRMSFYYYTSVIGSRNFLLSLDFLYSSPRLTSPFKWTVILAQPIGKGR